MKNSENKVIEVITKKHDTCEKDGKINKIARTAIHLSNGESVVEFGEARTWQAAGNRSLKTAVNAAGITYEDTDGKVAFLV